VIGEYSPETMTLGRLALVPRVTEAVALANSMPVTVGTPGFSLKKARFAM